MLAIFLMFFLVFLLNKMKGGVKVAWHGVAVAGGETVVGGKRTALQERLSCVVNCFDWFEMMFDRVFSCVLLIQDRCVCNV